MLGLQVCAVTCSFSLCLLSHFLCQSHAVSYLLIAVALQYKTSNLASVPPALLSLPRIAFGVLGYRCFHVIGFTLNLRISFGSGAMWTILILPVQEQGYCLTFLVAETKIPNTQVKGGGKVYLAHSLRRFQSAVSWPLGRMAQQKGVAEEKQLMTEQGSRRQRGRAAAVAAVVAAAPAVSRPFCFTQAPHP